MVKTRYLFVNNKLTGGGSERVMILLANSFADKGLDVDMIVLSRSKKSYYMNPKIKVIWFECRKGGIYYYLSLIKFIRKVIGKYDGIISFMSGINSAVLFASMGMNKKVIVSERNNPAVYKTKAEYVIKKVNNWLYLKAHCVVFQTEDAMNCFPKMIRKKGNIIQNPVDSKLPEACKGERDKRIVSVGRLNAAKNHAMLIKAFSKFYQYHRDYILEIYGEGSERDILEAMVQEYALKNIVFFRGFVSNVSERIRKASVFVLPSNYEGMPNALMEAMALGIPCIATDCPSGGVRKIIEDRKNGILIPVNDVTALYASMEMLVNDECLRKTISYEAQKIRTANSIEVITKQWLNLF